MTAGRSRAAAITLALLGATLAAGFLPHSGTLPAVLFSLAVAAFWIAGTPRRLPDLLCAAGLAASLATGALAATGALFSGTPGAGLFGLLLGVTAIPLAFTSAAFALRFDPPDPEELRRLREGRE